MADIGVVVGQLACLLGDRRGDLAAAVAGIDAIEPGEGVEAAAAIPVDDVDAFAGDDDAIGRVAARMIGHVGRGVEEMVAVPGGEFVGAIDHGGDSLQDGM
jgi:hypothetical protein